MKKELNVTSNDISRMMRRITKLNEGKDLTNINIYICSDIITDLMIDGFPKKYEYNKITGVLKEIHTKQR